MNPEEIVCHGCKHHVVALYTTWCVHDEAAYVRGTNIPFAVKCRFREPGHGIVWPHMVAFLAGLAALGVGFFLWLELLFIKLQ